MIEERWLDINSKVKIYYQDRLIVNKNIHIQNYNNDKTTDYVYVSVCSNKIQLQTNSNI